MFKFFLAMVKSDILPYNICILKNGQTKNIERGQNFLKATKKSFELADGLGISLLFLKFPLHFVEIAYHFFIFTQQNQFFKTNQLQV